MSQYPRATSFLAAVVFWHGVEAALAAVAGWPLNWRSPVAMIARDLLLPWLWVQGWAGDSFEWRGNAMTVAEEVWGARGEGRLDFGDLGQKPRHQ